MPSEEYKPSSARINFGIPNSEYILRVDNRTGKAFSCYNQDTNTEYIGGGGGGDSDFSTAEVTITNNNVNEIPVSDYLILENVDENFSVIRTTTDGASITDTPVTISTYYDVNKHSVMIVDANGGTLSNLVGCEIVGEFGGRFAIAITNSVASFAVNAAEDNNPV